MDTYKSKMSINKTTRSEESRFYLASIKDYLYNALSLLLHR